MKARTRIASLFCLGLPILLLVMLAVALASPTQVTWAQAQPTMPPERPTQAPGRPNPGPGRQAPVNTPTPAPGDLQGTATPVGLPAAGGTASPDLTVLFVGAALVVSGAAVSLIRRPPLKKNQL